MGTMSDRVGLLRSSSPTDAARLVFRKTIHRKVDLRRYGYLAGESTPPHRPLELRLDLLGPDRFDMVFATNPHFEPDDPERFHAQDTTCIVIWDGDRIAASSWMTRGRVYVHELQRHVQLASHEHFFCRSYAEPDYRGLALFSHMIHGYSSRQDPNDIVWGLVFAWNLHSIRSLERIGQRHTGDYWTRWVLGRRFHGERRFAALPPTTLDP